MWINRKCTTVWLWCAHHVWVFLNWESCLEWKVFKLRKQSPVFLLLLLLFFWKVLLVLGYLHSDFLLGFVFLKVNFEVAFCSHLTKDETLFQRYHIPTVFFLLTIQRHNQSEWSTLVLTIPLVSFRSLQLPQRSDGPFGCCCD